MAMVSPLTSKPLGSLVHCNAFKSMRPLSASATFTSSTNSVVSTLLSFNDVAAAKVLGTAIAKKALEKGIDTVVFDRGGFLYAGKIQALAEAAREAGLNF